MKEEIPIVVAVDTETTGLGHVGRPPRPDGVVQIGLSWRLGRGPVRTWWKTCNPGSKYLEGGRAREALEVNRLTETEVMKAPSAREVAGNVRDVLAVIAAKTGRAVELRAYNRDFDAGFLSPAPWQLNGARWGPCVMKAAAVHVGGPYGRWLRLPDAVAALGIEWPEGPAHNAGTDSHAALLVDEVVTPRRKTEAKEVAFDL